MIITQNEEKEAVLVGNIQNNKVGIDRNNIDFITTLLSTNLYSEPIQSFLRETTANGWDSQVEAGNTDTPLIIRVFRDNSDIKISIRDFGTGLSPERFDTIYRNIGSSTKRDTNDYIGCMGIGRFAALSCSNIVHINSFYNNNCYSYVMYKDGVGICIDKLHESTGNYQNGVEVTVTICKVGEWDKIKCIVKGLEALSYFEGVYLECQDGIIDWHVSNSYSFVKDFNERKIHDFGPFKVCTNCNDNSLSKCNVLMGNVLYPIKSDLVKKYMYDLEVSIAIKCNIGDLDITPNREGLQYNTKTTKAIEDKLAESRAVIVKIIEDKLSKDFSKLEEWYDVETSGSVSIPLYKFNDNCTISIFCYKSTLGQLGVKLASTVNGVLIPDRMLEAYRKFIHQNIPQEFCTYRLNNGKFYVEKASLGTIANYIYKYDEGRIYLLDEPYKPITKRYFVEEIDTGMNIYFLNARNFKKHFYRTIRLFVLYFNSVSKSKDIIYYPKDELKMIWNDFKRNYFKPPTFTNLDVPQEYKDEHKAAKAEKKAARKCVIYQAIESDKYDYATGVNKTIFDSTIISSSDLPKFKGKVIYAEKDNVELPMLFTIFRNLRTNMSHYKFVEVAPTNMPILASYKNCTSIDLFLASKDSVLSKFATSLYLKNELQLKDVYTSVEVGIPSIDKIKKDINLMFTFTRGLDKFRDGTEITKFVTELYELYIKKNWLDLEFLGRLNEIPSYLNFYKFMTLIQSDSDIAKKLALSYFIYANKMCISNKVNLNEIKSCLQIVNHNEPIQTT